MKVTFRVSQFPFSSPYVVLSLVAIAINVPFVHQAFHMDDSLYLLLARNVHNNAWFPQDMPVVFEGLSGADLSSTEHPWPFTPYLMALCMRLAGYSEICMHTAFLAFPIILAVSMYSVARRFTHHPALASASLLCLPAVYVMSHTLMADIPLLSLWLASLALFCRGLHSGRMNSIRVSAAASSLALLLSYSGCALVLLLVFYAILHGNRRAATLALAVPASVFAIWTIAGYFHYHRVTPGLVIGAYISAKQVLHSDLLIQKSASVILNLGGVTIFPLVLLAAARRRAVAAAMLSACASALFLAGSVSGPWQKAMLILFLGAGFTAVIEIAWVTVAAFAPLRRNLQDATEDVFLGTWFFGMLLFNVTVYMTGSARYLLPALPPLILMVFRRIEFRSDEKKLFGIVSANLVLTGSLALSLAIADFQFAGIYREFASSLKTSRYGSGTRLWFTGEWGFRAYLEQLGGRELGRRDARPKPGDLLVVPRLATPYQTLFSDTLALDAIAMAAPSQMTFDTPPLPGDSALVYTIGMPFYSKSDGLDFSVSFQSSAGSCLLHHERLLPAEGRRWRVQEISLQALAGEAGSIVFSADVGDTGNADADWLALARARICRKDASGQSVLYDFRDHLRMSRIDSVPGIRYQTDGNRPVLAMKVWLEQEPATVLRSKYEYGPAFPFRLLDERSHAGFWGSSWGLLPFSFSSPGSSLESISVFEITRPADAYGEVTPSWYKVSVR